MSLQNQHHDLYPSSDSSHFTGHAVCMVLPKVRSRGLCRYPRPLRSDHVFCVPRPPGLSRCLCIPCIRSYHVVYIPRPQVRSRGWCRGCRLVWSRGLYDRPSGQITWVVSGLPIGLVTWSVCPSLRSDHVGGVGAADWSGHVVCMPRPQVRSRGWCRGCRLVWWPVTCSRRCWHLHWATGGWFSWRRPSASSAGSRWPSASSSRCCW